MKGAEERRNIWCGTRYFENVFSKIFWEKI